MRIILLALITLFFCSCQEKDSTLSKTEKKTLPTQNMLFARTFPDQMMDMKALRTAFANHAELAEQSQSKNNGPDSPWRQEGPTNIGGRLNSVAIHPTNPDIIFTGSSTGGLYRTLNGGDDWQSVADGFEYLAIGDIVFDPVDPQIIYTGTGDPNITILPHPGNGVYRSPDNGDTWVNIGLNNAGIISEIAINPSDNQIIYAASMGLPFETSNDRGLYRSQDGGQSWEQILFVSDDAGIIDIVMDPTNPQILYAASWDRIRNNTESVVYEDDSKIFKTIDGGESWIQLTNGLPGNDQVRIGLDISAQDSETLVALYVGQDMQVGGIYRTENGGDSWDALGITGLENALGGFGWYFGKIRMNPFDDQEITVLGVGLYTSFNNGQSWEETAPVWWTYEVHADKHDLVYYDENLRFLATDGGLYKHENAFNGNWIDIENLPITQFYRIAIDPHNPGIYAGGAQDNGTTEGSFQDLVNWPRVYGGDGFQPTYDPENSDLFYAETQRGGLVFDDGFGFQSWTFGIDDADRRFWDMPYIMSAHSTSRFYTGTYRIYRIDDAPYGSWYPISDDITDGDVLGGSFNTISTVAESPINEDIIYGGTTDGNVWRTLDGGNNWTDITEGLPERYVTNIKASSDNENVLFVTHNGYKDNDNISHLHMSLDYGDNWIDISGDLPEIPINHIEMMGDDTLFIATDVGVYFSIDQGVEWLRIGNNMPLIPVFDIEIDSEMNRLVAGTFARSIMSFPLDSLFQEPIGLSDLNEIEIHLFPNPFNEFIQLQSDINIDEIRFFDLKGRLLDQRFNIQNKTIETSNLSTGTYVVEIRSGNDVFRKKMIKK
ncbi:MAG: T9SS type A sorting domain-containing protein [Bacteroidota bacterium]